MSRKEKRYIDLTRTTRNDEDLKMKIRAEYLATRRVVRADHPVFPNKHASGPSGEDSNYDP